MKQKAIAVLMIAALSACGGGSGGSSNNSSDNSSNNNNSNNNNNNTPPLSTGMSEAMRVFAESWISQQLVISLHDLVIISGNSGNCPKGGSVSFSGNTTTANGCVRRFPADNSYTGSFGGAPVQTGTLKTLNYQSTGAVAVGSSDAPGRSNYSIVNTSFLATDDGSNPSYEVTQIGNGSASFSFSISNTSSNYALTAVGSTVGNAGSSLSVASGFFYNKNSNTASRVITPQNILLPTDSTGMTQYPNTGQYNVAVGGASTACVNVGVQFAAGNQLTISCSATNETLTLNWSDSRVKTALTAARS